MKNFTFAKKWHEVLKDYSSEIRNEIYIACIEYFFTGQIIEMQPICRMAFDFIRHDMDERERINAMRREKRKTGKKFGGQVSRKRDTATPKSDSTPPKRINKSDATPAEAPEHDDAEEKSAAISALLGGLATHAQKKALQKEKALSTQDQAQAPKQNITVDRDSRLIKFSVKKNNADYNGNRAYSSR